MPKLILTAVFTLLAAFPCPSYAREWQDVTKTHSVEGELSSVIVVIKLSDETEAKVDLEHLSEKDQVYVLSQLQAKLRGRKRTRRAPSVVAEESVVELKAPTPEAGILAFFKTNTQRVKIEKIHEPELYQKVSYLLMPERVWMTNSHPSITRGYQHHFPDSRTIADVRKDGPLQYWPAPKTCTTGYESTGWVIPLPCWSGEVV